MQDFTRSLITENDIRGIVNRIFVDAVILQAPYTILSVGKNLSEILGVHRDQFNGLPLSGFSKAMPSKSILTSLLNFGYFEKYETSVEDCFGEEIPCSLSGFYFGIIGDVSDLIILNFSLRERTKESVENMQVKKNELDDFIYATSHDLRGPLATLKGLINLMKLPGKKNYKFLHEKMSYFADNLDDRLHKLIYFAESDKGAEFSEHLTLEEILDRLILSREAGHFSTVIRFSPVTPLPTTKLKEGKLILALFYNIKLFFMRNGDDNFEIELHANETDTSNNFILTVHDFFLTPEQRQNFEVINFGYTEILTNPQFTDIYSAKKIILKLQGSLYLETRDNKVSACISIPRT